MLSQEDDQIRRGLDLLSQKKFTEVVQLFQPLEKKVSEKSELYADYLKGFAISLEQKCAYPASIEKYEKLKCFIEGREGRPSSESVDAQFGIVKCLTMLKDTDERLTMLRQLEGKIQTFEKIRGIYFGKVKVELGACILDEGSYEEALLELRQAEQVLNAKSDDLYIYCQALIGFVYARQGKYQEALEIAKKAEERARKTVGFERQSSIILMRNLGSIISYLGNYDLAQKTLREVKQNCRKSFGKQHSLYSSILNAEGANYHRYKPSTEALRKKALECYEEGKVITENLFGKEHIQYVYLVYNLGGIYSSQKKTYKEAEECFKESLSYYEALRGEDNPRFVDFLIGTGKFYCKSDQIELAKQYLARAQKIYIKNKFSTPATMINLNLAKSMVARKEEDWIEAITHYEEVIQMRQRMLGKEHPEYKASVVEIQKLKKEIQKSPALLIKFEQRKLGDQGKPLNEVKPSNEVKTSEYDRVCEQLKRMEQENSTLKERMKEYQHINPHKIILKVLSIELKMGHEQFESLLVFGILSYAQCAKQQIIHKSRFEKASTLVFDTEYLIDNTDGLAVEGKNLISHEGHPERYAELDIFGIKMGEKCELGRARVGISGRLGKRNQVDIRSPEGVKIGVAWVEINCV